MMLPHPWAFKVSAVYRGFTLNLDLGGLSGHPNSRTPRESS